MLESSIPMTTAKGATTIVPIGSEKINSLKRYHPLGRSVTVFMPVTTFVTDGIIILQELPQVLPNLWINSGDAQTIE
jgi:hypothetical protein